MSDRLGGTGLVGEGGDRSLTLQPVDTGIRTADHTREAPSALGPSPTMTLFSF